MIDNPAQRERIYRRNFFFFAADGILFMVAMGILSPATVIPDFVRRLTDSEILIGLSGNMFAIGFTLPQLFIARYIVRAERKKWWFISPNIPVRFVMLIFAGIILWLGKDRPEPILLAFLVCYSIAALGDGLVGVPWADLTGTSLNERWRARMFGTMSAGAGIIMLGIVPLIGFVLGDSSLEFPNNYAALFAWAGIIFALSILPGIFIQELPGAKAVDKLPPLKEFVPGLARVLRRDVPFRALIVTRVFTNLFLMATPFYIGFATEQLNLSSEVAVPNLLAMQTLGMIGSALVYTWLGAHNNILYIRAALLGAALLPASALLSGTVGPWPLYWGFLLSGLATTNLSFSYQNWVVTYAREHDRPLYVGLTNTVTALVSLGSPFIAGTIVQHISYEALFSMALMMALSAFFVTVRYIHNAHPPQVAPVSVGGD